MNEASIYQAFAAAMRIIRVAGDEQGIFFGSLEDNQLVYAMAMKIGLGSDYGEYYHAVQEHIERQADA